LNEVIFSVTPRVTAKIGRGIRCSTPGGELCVGEYIQHYVIFNHVVKKRKAY